MIRLIAAVSLLAATPAFAAGCADRIAFVKGVIDGDLKTGFIGKSVHAQMTQDLAAASAACKAGDDGRANAIVSATQERHGYPVR